jgi:vacuolar-type H+-ATPase subunit H
VTAPTEPTPGAPATEPTPQPAPTPGAPEQPTEDITSLPEWAQKQIRDARAEAAKSRTTAKQTAAQEARDQVTAQIAKALGIGQEGEPVSAEDLAGQIEDAQTAAWVSSVELQIYRTASALGADADALLDSNAFRQSIDELGDQDPRTPEFAEALKAKVQEALDSKPDKFRTATAGQAPASPRPDPSQGARGPAVTRPTSLGDAVAQHYAAKR